MYCAVFICCTTCCRSLSLIVFAVTRYHSLSLVATGCTTRCHTLYHSLSFVVSRCTTRCHSMSFVVTCCTTRCHSLSLNVPLACLFINDVFLNYGELPDNKNIKRTIHIYKIKKVNLCNNLLRYFRSFENWFNMIGILA